MVDIHVYGEARVDLRPYAGQTVTIHAHAVSPTRDELSAAMDKVRDAAIEGARRAIVGDWRRDFSR